jgi:predicted outer membrane repeat protein
MRTALWTLIVLYLATGCGDPTGSDTALQNTPPSITLTSPSDGSSFLEGQVVPLALEVDDPDEADLAALTLAWTGSGLPENPPEHVAANGSLLLDLTPAPGAHEITVVVTDPDGDSGSATVTFTVVPDGDGDGYGSDDCNDDDPDIHPGAAEVCNGIDDDCANGADDGLVFVDWYDDADADGYCDPATGSSSCDDRSATHVVDGTDCDDGSAALNHDDVDFDGTDTCAGDCDDLDAAVEPGATEVCNGIDDDCADGIDEGFPTTDWYADTDQDGYGDPGSVVATCLDLSATRVLDGSDCDDSDAALNHDDADDDGSSSCLGDCNDLDALVNPNQEEVCNGGIDDDCDLGTVETAMVDGVGYSSLADAVAGAPAGGTVELCAGVFYPATAINVSKVVTIVGAGPDRSASTLDGSDASNNAMFVVSAAGELHLESLIVQNAPAGAVRGTGGAGVVFADDVTFLDNATSGNGGAISAKTLTVSNSTFTGNDATLGGAVFVFAGGLLTVTDSTFDGNAALLDGGAFHTASPAVFTRGGGGVLTANGALVTFADTLFSDNTAYSGGALWVVGTSVEVDEFTTFDGNLADNPGTAYGGGVWIQASGKAVTWTGGTFVGNVSDAGGFAAGGGMVLDANDVGAAMGSIVASWMVLDGNATVGPAGANTGGGIWTQGAPITILDTITMNNTSDYGAGTSVNSGGGDVISMERVEYRGNKGVHAGATDIYDASLEMVDCIIEENVGDLFMGVQYGALLVDLNGDLTVTTSDLGVDAADNSPFDVLVNAGMLPTYDYGDGVSFFCDTVGGCM